MLERVGKEAVKSLSDSRRPVVLSGGRQMPFKTLCSLSLILAHPLGLNLFQPILEHLRFLVKGYQIQE